jgi:hypothetical protein
MQFVREFLKEFMFKFEHNFAGKTLQSLLQGISICSFWFDILLITKYFSTASTLTRGDSQLEVVRSCISFTCDRKLNRASGRVV